MPASAVQTKTWFRPNGWFTDRELGIVVNRVLRDDPSKGIVTSFLNLNIADLLNLKVICITVKLLHRDVYGMP